MSVEGLNILISIEPTGVSTYNIWTAKIKNEEETRIGTGRIELRDMR